MHILIVEDDLDMQKILKLYLQKEGFIVSTVSNGQDAIDFLSETQVHLVILDWMMPVKDGIQPCREIRLLKIPVKILMLTAKGEKLLSFQDIRLNSDTMEVMKQGERILLTKTEYELLKCFLSNQNQVLSREFLLDHIWGMDYEGDIRTVDTTIRRLRMKIGESMIQTRIGLGYTMTSDH